MKRAAGEVRPYSALQDAPRIRLEENPEPLAGIDMLSFVVPVREALPTVRFEGGRGFMAGGAGAARYCVSFNPSRVLVPRSVWLCPTRQLREALTLALERLGHGPDLPMEAVLNGWPTRLDVARDFTAVTHLPALLEGLRHVPGRHGSVVRTYDNRSLGLYWNGQARGKASSVELYDQHRRRPSMADPGAVRFEVRARETWLQRAGIATVGDITAGQVDRLLLVKWSDSRFGTPVSPPWDVIDAIFKQDWPLRVRDRHACDVLRLARGYAFEGSPRHRRDFLERLRSTGVMTDLETSRRVRLDIWTGREVEER